MQERLGRQRTHQLRSADKSAQHSRGQIAVPGTSRSQQSNKNQRQHSKRHSEAFNLLLNTLHNTNNSFDIFYSHSVFVFVTGHSFFTIFLAGLSFGITDLTVYEMTGAFIGSFIFENLKLIIFHFECSFERARVREECLIHYLKWGNSSLDKHLKCSIVWYLHYESGRGRTTEPQHFVPSKKQQRNNQKRKEEDEDEEEIRSTNMHITLYVNQSFAQA